MAAKISRVFGVLCGGSISALITLCYAIGYGLMIFSDSLERYASVGIPSLLIGVCLVGLVITLWRSQQFRIAGPDSNTAAILAVSLFLWPALVWMHALKEGQTVNIAYRVLRLARGGELCLSNDIFENPQVANLLDSFGVPPVRVDTDVSQAKAWACILQR